MMMNKKNLVTMALSLLGAASLNAQMGNQFQEIYTKTAMLKKNIAQQSDQLQKLRPQVDQKAQARIDKFSNWLQKFNQNITKFEEGLRNVIERRSQWLAKMTDNMEKFNERFIKFQENVKKQMTKKQQTTQPVVQQPVVQQPAVQQQVVQQPAVQQPVVQQATGEQVAVKVKLPNGTVKQTILQFTPDVTPKQKQQAIAQAQQEILAGG